jgi:hypothetical protein
MKATLLILFFALIYTASNAQTNAKPVKDTAKIVRICSPSRSSILTSKPMVLVYSHKQTSVIYIDVDSISKIDPKFIKSINVLKDSTATRIYGNGAKAGVIQIYLDDEKYPDAYKLLMKKDSTKSIKQ